MLPQNVTDPPSFSRSNLSYYRLLSGSFPQLGTTDYLMSVLLHNHRSTNFLIYLLFEQSVSMFRTHSAVPI
jgi:hypothetical protein